MLGKLWFRSHLSLRIFHKEHVYGARERAVSDMGMGAQGLYPRLPKRGKKTRVSCGISKGAVLSAAVGGGVVVQYVHPFVSEEARQ